MFINFVNLNYDQENSLTNAGKTPRIAPSHDCLKKRLAVAILEWPENQIQIITAFGGILTVERNH
eukprot:COSAG02_NODE_1954_length_10268_cov_8.158718_2_plen_65_part_00